MKTKTKISMAVSMLLLSGAASAADIDADAKLKEIDGKFPYLARIVTIDGSFRNTICGATILNKDTVLTTAGCISKSGGLEIGVVFRDYEKNDWSDTDLRLTESVTVHDKYDHMSKANDIAIVKLASPIEEEKRYARLPDKVDMETLLSESVYFSAGFGNHNVGIASNTAKIIETDIQSDSYCKANMVVDSYSEVEGDYPFSSDLQTCATLKGVERFCDQDDGNPIAYYDSVKGVYQPIGMLSNSNEECNINANPELVVYIEPYQKWIEGNLDGEVTPPDEGNGPDNGNTDNGEAGDDSDKNKNTGGGSFGFLSLILLGGLSLKRKKATQ